MTFTVTLNNNGKKEHTGTLLLVTGTYVNTGGSTGGEVGTGLREVLYFAPQDTSSATITIVSVANETFPLAGENVTLICDADQDGIWMAIGR